MSRAREAATEVQCKMCHCSIGFYFKKDIPKEFVCPECGTGQKTGHESTIGYSHKRNYPEGFFDQN